MKNSPIRSGRPHGAMMRPEFSAAYTARSLTALTTALQQAPAYSSWRAFDPGETAPVDARYAAMPMLSKNDIRLAFPQGLVPAGKQVDAGIQSGEIEYVQTSGTTQEKVTNLWHQSWWNASEKASWALNSHTAGLDGAHREAELVSALNVGRLSHDDLPMQERLLGRLLYLNEKAGVAEWTDYHLTRMLHELKEYQPIVLEANPSFLAHLAWWVEDHRVEVYQPPVILLTYECASALHLAAIRRVFQAPLTSSYGTTETGYVFMECEHGRLHQNTEFCRVDVQPLRPEHGGPGVVRLLVTTFQNPWVCMVRFDTGDLARLDDSGPCACGRHEGFRLAAIEGRLANATLTPEGRLVTPKAVDDALAAVEGLRDYQVVQTSSRDYHLHVVCASHGAATVRSYAHDALVALYGPKALIHVEERSVIEPTASGKYRRTHALFDIPEKGLWA